MTTGKPLIVVELKWLTINRCGDYEGEELMVDPHSSGYGAPPHIYIHMKEGLDYSNHN
jgi:hypothetical protein